MLQLAVCKYRWEKGKEELYVRALQARNCRFHLHPTSITQTVKIFSVSVLGATFPNPTDVKEVKVKYSAVM